MKNSHKFLIVMSAILLVVFCFFTCKVSATTVDLSDYINCNLTGGSWCIVYSHTTNGIYLVTPESTSYPYLAVSCSIDDNGYKYPSGGWSSYAVLGNYGRQASCYCYTFNFTTNKFENRTKYGIGVLNLGNCDIIACGKTVYVNHAWTDLCPATPVPDSYLIPGSIIAPCIHENADWISKFVNGRITIDVGSVESSEDIYFWVDRLYDDGNYTEMFSCTLNENSSYYVPMFSLDSGDYVKYYYGIPYTDMCSFSSGTTYRFCLYYIDETEHYYRDSVTVTFSSVTESEKLQDSINSSFDSLNSSINSSTASINDNINSSTSAIIESNEQTQQAIEEQTQVNINIFQSIGELLSYINPFSENFFVYKLIDLLVNALKSLFIPGDDFFGTFFSDLNDWFSDRLGFLYYPLDLLFDLCSRFICINFSEPVFDIPDIIEPTTNTILIHATQYNFNSLLENSTLNTVHDIYLVIVDAVIFIGLVILLYNKYEEVMTK